MLLATVLALVGLTNHLFWDDEANTASYARNLLRFGRLTAWDGTNLVGYAYGGALGPDLGQELRVPALPAYVAALGMILFDGTSLKDLTFSGRIMFVVAGVLSVGLLAIWTRRYFGRRFPWYLPSLILAVSPAYLLYIRNCRYYALGVMFTLLVWMFWVPGVRRFHAARGRLFDSRSLLRYAGAAIAVLLLIGSHYLNAAAVLVTLPLFFFDRRFRQPRQYVLLGAIYAAALLYAGWILLTANPFAADYRATIDATLQSPQHATLWGRYAIRYATNFWWFLRDLGTHEFFPWCLVPVLVLPWLFRRLRGARRLSRRGGVLLAVVVANSALAAVLTPPDMGLGPTAEMRYVVPLIAVGSAVGGLAVVILWRLSRPMAAMALLLLVATNLLYPGFIAKRFDGTRLCWPPTLYRYVAEAFHDYPTGTEAMVDLLEQLPPGTTVRVFPGHMVYPAMFYVPKLHYCDQLSTSKKTNEELGPMPEYLFKERARPQVWLVPSPYVQQKLSELEDLAALDPGRTADSYTLKSTLPAYWQYTSKPEIPWHAFSRPTEDWYRLPFMSVLVLGGSPVQDHPALRHDPHDANTLYRMGLAFANTLQKDTARQWLQEALKINPKHVEAHYELGTLLLLEEQYGSAIKHLDTTLKLEPDHWGACLNIGKAYLAQGRNEQARQMFWRALEIKPELAIAHYNLGNIALREPGGPERAIVHYRKALEVNPRYVPAHVNWGILLFQQGKIDEAIAHYRAALRINPFHLQAHASLGMALQKRGDPDGARRHLQQALDRVPPDSVMGKQLQAALKEINGSS
ncbi:MAG: hypothetical protein A2V70_12335 [Planctomycetes bacterium RBG_13_63_9]|nr:MAG: hypothetical protein A2V70_12335 [Planctomycetes bacterium RBG_13_63_9]